DLPKLAEISGVRSPDPGDGGGDRRSPSGGTALATRLSYHRAGALACRHNAATGALAMPGSVITFYSYKGGVGRSFALANIAVILAQWGFRVLAVDWDIEAPGLHHYYADLKPQFGAGVLDFIDTCARDAEVSWQDYASHVPLPDASERLFLMPAALGGGADY